MMTTAVLFFTLQVNAQRKDYVAGERIEWKSSGYPEIWVEATFLRATPDGSQPVIREKPNQFYKEGFERTTNWADIRPVSAKTVKEARVQDKKDEPPTPPNTDLGTGLMTQAEVLGFLQKKMGDKPFQNPRREEIKKELAELIKARGLEFRYAETSPDFFAQLAKFNAITSEVTFPLGDNYGPPTKQVQLMGAWNLGKIGARVDYVKNDRVYRQGEIGVANVGTLTINANGTYVWKSLTAQSTNGRWRAATKEEMRSKGGDGIVLLNAKSGYDWIVTRDRTTTLKGEWIDISELATRQIRENGSRGTKK